MAGGNGGSVGHESHRAVRLDVTIAPMAENRLFLGVENSATDRIADVADVRGKLPMPVTAPAATKGIRPG